MSGAKVTQHMRRRFSPGDSETLELPLGLSLLFFDSQTALKAALV